MEPFLFAVELQEGIKSPLLLNYYVINQKKKKRWGFFFPMFICFLLSLYKHLKVSDSKPCFGKCHKTWFLRYFGWPGEYMKTSSFLRNAINISLLYLVWAKVEHGLQEGVGDEKITFWVKSGTSGRDLLDLHRLG